MSHEELNAAFLEAVYKDKSDIAKYLVDRGADPHCNNAAISNENMELFDYLLGIQRRTTPFELTQWSNHVSNNERIIVLEEELDSAAQISAFSKQYQIF